MAEDLKLLDSPEKIADAGEKIYAERYRAKLEPVQLGHYVAIDVVSGKAFVKRYPEEALGEARKAEPAGVFHLIRIGAAGAFKVSFGADMHGFWPRTPRPIR